MKNQLLKKILAMLVTVWLTVHAASAASMLLTNSDIAIPGSGGLWSTGANWLGGVAPGPGDVVILSNSVASLAAVTSPLVGGYYTYIKGLAPDQGWTNAFDGLMPLTSIVESMTIGGLWVPQTNLFNNWALGNQFSEGAHNLYITNQLNIVSTIPRDLYHIFSNTVAVGTGYDITNMLCYATIQGPGSLNVTNPNGCLWVGQGSQTVGAATATHAAVLDLTGLNNFNCVLSNIFVASDFWLKTSGTDTNLTGYARPQGCLFLALTNHITLLDTNFPAYIVGYEPDNNGSTLCISNCLGQVNYLNFDQMLIGGPKASSSVGGMYFMPTNYSVALRLGSGVPALTDCYAKFRNIDGVSRQTTWAIGDNSLSPGTTGNNYGNVNFTRGGVDALVDTIYVGRGGAPLITTAIAVGTLNFGAGTTNLSLIDVNQLEVGDMLNQTGPCQGTVIVYSNATLNVNNYIRLINIPSGASSSLTSRGFLYIYGGTVQVSGDILNNATAGGGFSILTINNGGTLDMQPTNAKPPGNIAVATLNLGKGTLTNFATLNVSNLVVTMPNTTFALNSGQALSPGGAAYSDVLTIGATNLVPVTYATNLDGTIMTNNGNGLVGLSLNNSVLIMDAGTSSDKINVNGGITLAGVNQVYVNLVAGFAAGTYPILTYNTNTSWLDCSGNPNYGLTGDVATQLVAAGPITNSSYVVTFDASTPGVVYMNVGLSVSMSLTWVGDGSANAWDIVGANNWNNGSGASKFYQYDTVTFDDSGSASPAVNLTGSAYPSSVTCNASQNYTIAGSGQITGGASLTKSGSGVLTLLESNSFTGGTTISAGTVKLGDGATAMGTLGTGLVNVGGTLAVAVITNQTQNLFNALTGAGVVSVAGPGTVVLSGTNQTYTGNFIVSGGALVPAALMSISYASSASSKLIYVTNNGTLDINGLALSNNITISGAGLNGAGALVNNGGSQANSTMQIFLAGDATVGGNYRMDLNNVGSTTPGGVTGNGYNLAKVGTNCVSLFNVATNVWTNGFGNIIVNAGVLRLQNGTVLGGNPAKTLTVASGATFEMNNVWTKAPVNIVATFQDGSCLYGTGGVGTNISGVFTNTQGNIFAGTINLNGTDLVDTSTNSVLVINGVIGGNGNLVKGIGNHPASATTAISTGAGTLVLGAMNNFTGNLAVQTGTVVLTNNGAVASAANITLAGGVLNASARTDGALTVGANQTLGGVGMVIGNLNVPTNAFISPGNAIGVLTNVGNVILAGTTTMTITKTNGVTSYSQLGVSGGLQLGGTLNVTYTGSGLTNGDKFQLFSSAIISSNFTTVNLPAVATWTDNTSVDGSIVVASVVAESTNPPSLTAVAGSGAITLSWPLTYSSYLLQSQTNTLIVGLSTNWATVPTTNNSITLPINPANGSVFYRLKH